MKLLHFKNWLVESYFLEMATLNFGGHRGKDHTQTPTHYLQWMRDQVASGQGNFNLTDQGRKLTNKEILANIDTELAKRKGGTVPSPVASAPTPVAAKPAVNIIQGWVWAKSIMARPDYDLPTANLDLAMKQYDANNWMFVILDPEEGRLVSRGLIPTADLKNVVKRETKDGQPVKANKPSELLQMITPKKQHKGNTIPDDRLTQEQKAIEERFAQMLASPKQSHMMINALAGSGKAQPLDSLLLTPKGWIEMGNIKVGDLVYGSDGMPHVVKGVFPQGMKEIFEVKFTDNTSVECCEEHLWTTENRKNRWKCMRDGKPIFSLKETNSTKKLAEDLICKDRLKHYIPLVEPINFLKKKVKIDPYVMGVLLGDGCFRSGNLSYSTQDQEIIKSVDDYLIKETNLISKHKGKGYDYRITGNKKGIKNPLILEIKRLNLWDKSSRNKFIPDDYKFNDVSTRIAVLQGLLDTDGHVKPNTANIEYSTVSEQLCDDVKFLVESLGGTVTIKTRIPTFFYKGIKKNGQLCYRMTIKLNNNFIPFRLSRKIKNYKPREKYFPKRAIASIQSLGIQKECQCISIDSEDNLYVTNNCILTHNTTVLKHLAWKFSQGKKWLYLVFNAKNKEEAKEEFPPNVQVETTNGWAGREVLGKNHLQPTDRIQDYSTSDKARLVADSSAFKQLMKSLRIPDQEEEYGPDPKQLSGTERGLWYILRSINSEFKSEAVRLLGLAKSYAIDPRDTKKLQDNLRAVMDKYDLNTDLDDIKERLQKNSPWAEPYISQLMNQNFLSRSFEDELAQATTWLLQQVMPHASQETFTADAGRFRGTEQKLGTKRDFDDDLWFSAIHADELNWPKYDVVLADEVQDFNVAQKIILKKLAEKGAKIVAVGDPNQCHPAGTMISLTGGIEKPIEELQIGDMVVTYNSKKSFFPGVNVLGRKVLEVACRDYTGDLITLTAGNYSHQCTPNHKCLVKLNADSKYCLYLMNKGNRSRIGICRANYENGFGLTVRAVQENADQAWVLDIFDTEKAARIAESVTAAKFGLPEIIFANKGQLNPSQDVINEIYEQIGDNTDNAKKCLSYFGRLWEYPIWTKQQQMRFGKLKKNYIGSKKTFVTQACNIISGFMFLRTFDGSNRGGKWEIANAEKTFTSCKVYSLHVEATEDNKKLYIANGIVTHNSIYRFRGSDSEAFYGLRDMLKSMSHDKNVEHGLTSNFRSRQAIIDMANDEGAASGHVSNLIKGKQFKEAPGKIGKGDATKYDVKYEQAFDTLKQEMKDMGEVKQTAFLARTNEPLVHASLKLMKDGVPFVILGKDIANDLNKHIDKIINLFRLNNNSSIRELEANLSSYRDEQVDQHSGKAAMAAKLKQLSETTDAMLSSIEQFNEEKEDGSVYEFRMWLRSKFGGLDIEKSGREGDLARAEYKKKLEEQNPVILSTVHKSKGLQFQRVFILRDDLWPHPSATRPEDLDQELNNRYIALTRGEDEAHILDLKGQPGYRDSSEEQKEK